MSKKLHIICGCCGSDADAMSFNIDLTGGCDAQGIEYPCVAITCSNCGELVTLDEFIDEVK